MDIERMERLIQAMNASSLTLLEIEEKELKIRMEKAAPVWAAAPAAAASAPVSGPQPVSAAAAEAAAPMGVDLREVVCPMVGIFHALKQEVKIGDRLKKGDTVCTVEAMKLMNDITMEEDGEIVWVGSKEGDLVEFGQQLYQYKPL